MGLENETYRVQCLQNFGEDERFSNILTVITLPKNSGFYWQKGDGFADDFIGTENFVDRMEALMFDKSQSESGFYFPPAWKEKDSVERKNIRMILDTIREILYPDQ